MFPLQKCPRFPKLLSVSKTVHKNVTYKHCLQFPNMSTHPKIYPYFKKLTVFIFSKIVIFQKYICFHVNMSLVSKNAQMSQKCSSLLGSEIGPHKDRGTSTHTHTHRLRHLRPFQAELLYNNLDDIRTTSALTLPNFC